MAKLRFLGTCSGTEPFENMHHTSFLIEEKGKTYWFDAGENCSRLAFLQGVDMLSVSSIFISHPHIDHIGGLLGLLLLIRQQIWRKGGNPIDGEVKLFAPLDALWENLHHLINVADSKLFSVMDVTSKTIKDGLVFDNGDIRVTALHNAHMGVPENGTWRSYSFGIEVAGKKIVYSGDIARLSELDALVDCGCDMLICESGHQKVAEILAYAEKKGIERLRFIHHGREIINDCAAAEALVKQYPHSAIITYDGMTEEI